MNAIVISIGGLRVSWLGCYGNAWIDTRHLDQLAAEGFVFDECFTACPTPAGVRRAWWTGRFASSPASQSVMTLLRAHGVEMMLIHNCGPPADSSTHDLDDFGHVQALDSAEPCAAVPDAARDWLAARRRHTPFFLFLDCRGAHPPWNPPEEQLQRYAQAGGSDAADPEQSELDEIDRGAPAVAEPAATGGLSEAVLPYAAAVSHCDEQVGTFLDELRRHPDWNETLLIVTSDFGEPPQQQNDSATLRLREAVIHVPLILRVPGAEHAARSPALVQSMDLLPTVLDAMGIAVECPLDGVSLLPITRWERQSVRDHLCFAMPGDGCAIRTPDWYLILPSAAAEPDPNTAELYIKPEDRWERNNVARQFPEVVEELAATLRNTSS
jgi:arylsulfatase A-like enzyme